VLGHSLFSKSCVAVVVVALNDIRNPYKLFDHIISICSKMDAVWSIGFFIGTFGLAVGTAYGICAVFGKPFFNPNDTVEIYQKKAATMAVSSGIAIVEGLLLSIYVFHKYITNDVHTWTQSFIQIAAYVVLVETVYYAYHRLVHLRWFYRNFHSTHHTIIDVHPFDTFYFDLVDVSALVFALALPIVFLQMNWTEHFITIYVYITSGLVSHSSVLYDHHVKHHRFLNCNYCLFLPIMDVLFDTYR